MIWLYLLSKMTFSVDQSTLYGSIWMGVSGGVSGDNWGFPEIEAELPNLHILPN